MGQDVKMEREQTKTLLKLAGGGGLVGRVIGNKLLTPVSQKNTFFNLYAFITETGADFVQFT